MIGEVGLGCKKIGTVYFDGTILILWTTKWNTASINREEIGWQFFRVITEAARISISLPEIGQFKSETWKLCDIKICSRVVDN